MFTLATYCLCSGELKVSSSQWQAIEDFNTAFVELHSGEGHELFPTAADRDRAARKAAKP